MSTDDCDGDGVSDGSEDESDGDGNDSKDVDGVRDGSEDDSDGDDSDDNNGVSGACVDNSDDSD